MVERKRPLGVCTGQRISPGKHALAKHLRRNMTKAERVFWDAVRNNKVMGLQFRRQQVIDGYIADFYCNQMRLVVELDGEVHDKQKEYDQHREDVIKRRDIRVLRFRNEEVLSDIGKVIAEIEKAYNTMRGL